MEVSFFIQINFQPNLIITFCFHKYQNAWILLKSHEMLFNKDSIIHLPYLKFEFIIPSNSIFTVQFEIFENLNSFKLSIHLHWG